MTNRCRRQIPGEQGKLTIGPRHLGRLNPVGELLERQSPFRDCFPQPSDAPISLGVACQDHWRIGQIGHLHTVARSAGRSHRR